MASVLQHPVAPVRIRTPFSSHKSFSWSKGRAGSCLKADGMLVQLGSSRSPVIEIRKPGHSDRMWPQGRARVPLDFKVPRARKGRILLTLKQRAQQRDHHCLSRHLILQLLLHLQKRVTLALELLSTYR